MTHASVFSGIGGPEVAATMMGWYNLFHCEINPFGRKVLNSGTMNICDSISYMYAWADHLGIDLDTHIKWKMKYNELRPYKHGGKKY